MYTSDSLQLTGMGVVYEKVGVIMLRAIYFSKEDSRGQSRSPKWVGGSRWNNVRGHGWYVLGPLNLVEWNEE